MKNIYKNLNRDKNNICSLLNESWGLDFDGLRCVQTDSIRLWEKNGVWWVQKFNDTKFQSLPSSANFEGLVFELTKHIEDGKERLAAQSQIIARCASNLPTIAQNTPKHNTNPKTAQKSGLNVEFCDLTDEALEYFAAKGGIKQETLERYETKTVAKLFGRKEYYLSVGWVVGDNIKVKRTKHPSKKYAQSTGKEPYIFGYNQLPKTGKMLVVCAGETDCLCVNEHCNQYDIWAICLRSENDLNTLIDSQINDLKARFERVYIVYDADKTGYQYSRELAIKTGFVWVNTMLYESWGNDICEMWQNGFSPLHFINHFTTKIRHTRINAVPNDVFSIDVPFVYELDFWQYLGENNAIEAVKDLLCIEHHLAIQSPAGTGKSTAILELCKAKPNGINFVKERLNLPKTIVCTPTVAIGEQLQKDFDKQGVSVSIIYESVKGEDLEVSRHDTLVICTFDSVIKVLEFVPNSLLIIDEFHQIANDYDYRKKAMLNVWNAMQNAPRVLLLSATPNHLFCSHLAPFFDFALLVGKPQKTNQININFLEHELPKKYLIDFIEENAPTGRGTVCVKYDNNNTLEAYHKTDLERGLEVEHFTSSDKYNKARRENNEHYNSIMETGKPLNPLQRLYFTTLFEAGVSLKFPVGLVAIFDVKSWSKIVQLSTRPRLHLDGNLWVNSTVNVWVFSSKNNTQNVQSKATTKERWLHYFNGASANAGYLNAAKGGDIEHTTTTDFKNFCSPANGVWIVNIPAILHEIFKQETSETDTQTLINRICRFDNRFTAQIQAIEASPNADLDALLEQAKASKEQAQNELFKLLQTQTATTIHAICKLSKDRELKADTKRVLGLPIADKEAINELIQNNPTAFAVSQKSRLLKDLIFLVGDKQETLGNAVQTVVRLSKKELILERDTHQRKARIKVSKESPDTQSPKARLEVERERAICKRIAKVLDNIKQGKRKNEFTPTELAKVVNSALDGLTIDGKSIATPKKIGDKAVISYLSQFYELSTKQGKDKNGKHIRIYSILKPIKLG